MTNRISSNRIRLSVMMLFQYMLFAVWWVPLAAYLTNMDVGATQKALILSSMAIGCMFSPIIGMIADRHFASEKVLAVLNFATALLLMVAGLAQNPDVLFISLLLAMICHMPTWSLTSAIAMTHAPSVIFPRIRVFGSIGWVVSGVFSLFTVSVLNLEFDGTNIPFYYGAGISLVAALFNLTLPKTPPPAKGQKSSVIDALGLRAVVLMKDKNFSVFIVISFLSLIPFAMYFSYCSEFLLDQGFRYISITMNWGQFAEMFFLLTVPIIISKAGLRMTMILGLVFMAIRYIAFYVGGYADQSWTYFIGILVHGLIYGYFYLGGQIYIDKRAPKELRAQAQGFIFLMTFGIGLLIGNLVSGKIIEMNLTAGVYDWDTIWGITTIFSVALVVFMLLFFRNDRADIENSDETQAA